jgi:phosphohistidine phosphatase
VTGRDRGDLLKTLLVMRHAKSDWAADFGTDHERPLNPRGLASARHMGRLVSDLSLIPDLVISSTAVRARTTAELAIESGGWESPLVLEPAFYGSRPETVLEIASATDDVGTLMIVGHQPTWGMIIHHLTGEQVEVKTATLVNVSLPMTVWSELPETSGVLASIHDPPH